MCGRLISHMNDNTVSNSGCSSGDRRIAQISNLSLLVCFPASPLKEAPHFHSLCIRASTQPKLPDRRWVARL